MLSVKNGYDFLLPEMLSYTEKELSSIKDGKKSLCAWITDKEQEKQSLLLQSGYQKIHTEPVRIFTYDKSFLDVRLPDGFNVISLEDENDYKRIHDCLWKGFDHGNTWKRSHESAPLCSHKISLIDTIVVATLLTLK